MDTDTGKRGDRLTKEFGLPTMLPKEKTSLYFLVAVANDGSALYEDRNWRMGGRYFKIRLADGVVVSGNDWGRERIRPKKPATGRWNWRTP